jgi:co-chaperonin GroES (HSP10)|tara:strand:+ start:518 stop:928 length:411 start_codon:yes stop_codon:yes gene_type:complete
VDTLAKFEGNLTAVGNRLLVSDMHFGEQTTKGGIILGDDDGNVRGIYPRWGKVHSKGPRNKDPYEIGQWVLIEHGRWTRGVTMTNEGEEEIVLRMVESESVLAYADEKPNDVLMSGSSVGDYAPDAVDPSGFVNAT